MWNLCKTAKAEINEWRPDIVYFHSTFTLPVLTWLKMTDMRMKSIYCAHGWAALSFEPGSLKRKLVATVEGNLSGFADVVINISKTEQTYAKSMGYRGRHVMIENAVGLSTLSARGSELQSDDMSDVLNVLFVGRFDKQKGLDILLDAFDFVSRERADIQLHVVGDAVLKKNEKFDQQRRNTTFYGWLSHDELERHYVDADLVVVPSRWEGFGLVVAESMRAGTPVLVSDQGSLPTLVEPGRTGYISELSVCSFRDALIRLSKSRLLEMRDACIEIYHDRFSADRYKKDFSVLCEALLERV
jgi:glycosyltransferase involved in cell wall biosynthesis